MSQAGQAKKVSGGSSNVNTLSAENVGPFLPVANNFNFSGTPAGGYGANGAIAFSGLNGEINAQVQVDGITVAINGANQLTAIGALILNWQAVSSNTATTPGNGYIAIGAGPLVFTLPAFGSAIGATIEIYSAVPFAFTVAQNANQNIQVNKLTTTTGVGGSVASTAFQGNALRLVCMGVVLGGGVETWFAAYNQGQLVVT